MYFSIQLVFVYIFLNNKSKNILTIYAVQNNIDTIQCLFSNSKINIQVVECNIINSKKNQSTKTLYFQRFIYINI